MAHTVPRPFKGARISVAAGGWAAANAAVFAGDATVMATPWKL
jgi:hypothetical protein